MDRNHSTMAKFLFMLLTCTCFCCKQTIEVETSSNLIQQKAVFENEQTAFAALSGLYTRMFALNLSLANGGVTVYAGLSADELENNAGDERYDFFYNNALLTNNSVIETNFWSAAYTCIYHANAIIAGLEDSNALTDVAKQPLIGEAKFIRAFFFFYLVNLFGDVPLTIYTDYRKNSLMARTPSDQVYEQITLDLLEAKHSIAEGYPNGLRGRPNKMAASALLARTYLYRGEWQKAEVEASAVINSALYALEPDLDKVFLSESPEAIWQLARTNANTAEASIFIPSSSSVLPTLSLSDSFIEGFEPGDARKSNWVAVNIFDSTPYYYPYKYKSRTSVPLAENLIMLRLAEQYLIRAEAKAQLDRVAEAIEDINAVRDRARSMETHGTSPLPKIASSLSKTEVMKAIEHERKVELFAEWGHRWFDLKRYNKIDVVLAGQKNGWQPYKALFPIPLAQIQLNPYLLQNIGYDY
ncbi:RagB/SusD family nutrient uptake outer membrane protein [Olivibacter sitiensis]|uniref:RagB/SusD family nutrient uptake outer membrane protein n=1 Tax=Olivibacter sitiensis TaxID=376470 RepID=UPI00146FB2AF|nr:RagB/SusD family nutrient uptake outer membrane protein [Olivibacter sitiensis]